MQLNGHSHGFQGHDATIFKSREIFKVQISLNVEDKILVYNKDRNHGIEIEGVRASTIIQQLGLNKFGKRKTYVYGKFLPTTKTIQLEAGGELPLVLTPTW